MANFESKYDFFLDHCEKLNDIKSHLMPFCDKNSQNYTK